MKDYKTEKTNILKKAYKTEIGRWIIAVCFCAVFYLIIYFIFPIVFSSDDDTAAMFTLAGYRTNGIPMDHPYLNYFLASVFRALYSISSLIPWYGICHVVIIFVSCVILVKSILKESYRKALSLIVPFIGLSALFIVVLVYPSICLQFTQTPAFAGSAACMLVVCQDINDCRRCKIIDTALACILMLFGFCMRKNSGYIIICFFALCILYKLFKDWKNSSTSFRLRLKRMFPLVLCMAIVFVGTVILYAGSNAMRNTDEWKEYRKFDNERYKVMDYPNDSYYDNPELYESMGWDAELYNIFTNWFFMDERITADNLEKIAQTGYYAQDSSVDEALAVAKNTFSNSTAKTVCYAAIISIGLFIVFCLNNKTKLSIWDILLFCGSVIGSLIMCSYLCWLQRFPLRVLFAVSIPSLVINIFVLIRVIPATSNNKSTVALINNVISGWIIVLFTIYSIGGTYTTLKEKTDFAIYSSNMRLSAENYAANNADKNFVCDLSLPAMYLPFITYSDKTPTNLISWGGTSWKSPVNNYRMSLMGYTDCMYSVNFFDNNVYYITIESSEPSTLASLTLPYMQSTYGNIECVLMNVIDPVNQIYVYQFKKVDTSGYSDGWHQKNGYNYYYENGHVKTGTFSVDGTMFYGNETHSFVKVVNEYGITVYQDTYGHVQQ